MFMAVKAVGVLSHYPQGYAYQKLPYSKSFKGLQKLENQRIASYYKKMNRKSRRFKPLVMYPKANEGIGQGCLGRIGSLSKGIGQIGVAKNEIGYLVAPLIENFPYKNRSQSTHLTMFSTGSLSLRK